MSERPILFDGSMVRAILAGQKTQTRRVVSDSNTQGNWKASELDLSKAWVDPGPSPLGNPGPYLHAKPTRAALLAHEWSPDDDVMDRLYPRWFPGDRLWVRETFRQGYGNADAHYRADEDECAGGPWRPSIHMPRVLSRLTLEITEVRVQRLQEISARDIEAEGCVRPGSLNDGVIAEYRHAFAGLWDEINAKRAPWDSNPWVWALTFRRIPS